MSLANLRDLTNHSDALNSPNPTIHPKPPPVLIVVEGAYDVDFLRLLTARLQLEDPSIPYLGLLEQIGRVIFVPFGGGRIVSWSNRFAALKCPEFHLYDREIAPETAIRQEVVALINRRPNCRALLLNKHSLENYLHSAAISDAGGGLIQVSNDTRMSTVVARNWFLCRPHDREWEELSPRARRRMANQAKRWLNTDAVDRMTLAMLIQSDPAGELLSWLRAITDAVGDT
ncbi:MAG: hypothetical protein JWM11_5147 [Planctomycetaceae bacterium]|nr:hypothetical protein [Planctomycetaceae bacterium]